MCVIYFTTPCLPTYLHIYLPTYLSTYLALGNGCNFVTDTRPKVPIVKHELGIRRTTAAVPGSGMYIFQGGTSVGR